MTTTSYLTIEKEANTEFKDRGSRFVAHCFPMADATIFKANLQVLKKEHVKSSHFCFGYRLGLDLNNYRSSDGGEPAGTAGKPILGQIDSRQLTDCGVIVVRYFGGTLLGVPGLINAYKTAASLVLQLVPVVEKPVVARLHLQFNYTQLNEVMQLLKSHQATILLQEQQLFCLFKVEIPLQKMEEFMFQSDRLHGLVVNTTA